MLKSDPCDMLLYVINTLRARITFTLFENLFVILDFQCCVVCVCLSVFAFAFFIRLQIYSFFFGNFLHHFSALHFQHLVHCSPPKCFYTFQNKNNKKCSSLSPTDEMNVRAWVKCKFSGDSFPTKFMWIG